MEGNNDNKSNSGFVMRLAFAIIMIVIYLGVGFLFVYNGFFNSVPSTAARLVIGILLMLYGVWRGVRLFINRPQN